MYRLPHLLLILLSVLHGTAIAAPITIHADPGLAYQQFQAELEKGLHAEQLHDNGEAALRITIGAETLRHAIHNRSHTPLLALLVTTEEFKAATQEAPDSPPIAVLYRDQPLDRLIRLTQIATPSIHKIGVLTAPDAPASALVDMTSEGLTIIQHPTENLRSALNAVLPDVDALITFHNPSVITPQNFKHILLSSYRQQIPLICHTAAMVKAGCILGVHSSTDQLLNHALEWISDYRHHAKDDKRFTPSYSTHYSVTTNPKVAQSLGFRLSNPFLLTQKLHDAEEAP